MAGQREGSLDAPTRHPIEWKTDEFWDENSLFSELERVYDICHGCRRCVSLCDSFPTLLTLSTNRQQWKSTGLKRQIFIRL